VIHIIARGQPFKMSERVWGIRFLLLSQGYLVIQDKNTRAFLSIYASKLILLRRISDIDVSSYVICFPKTYHIGSIVNTDSSDTYIMLNTHSFALQILTVPEFRRMGSKP
jgi:hypothetical protein